MSTEPLTRREILVLAVVVAVGLVLRLLVARTPLCISTDGVSYVLLAEQIAAGGSWFHPVFSPGYSLLIAAVYGVFGLPFEPGARYLAALSGALAIIPAWLMWRSIFGAVATGISCLLLAVWPLSVEFGGGVYNEGPSLLGLLVGLGVWLSLGRGKHWGWAGLTGLCWGLVAWMKPEVLAWSGLGCAVLLWRRQYRAGVLLAGMTGLVYLPYVLLVHEHTGRWQIAAKQDSNWSKAQAIGQGDYVRAYEKLREESVREQSAMPRFNPVQMAKRMAMNVYILHRYAVPQTWPPVFGALVAIGLFLAWRQGLLGAWLWLPCLAVFPLLVFIVDARIMHPLFVVLSALAGLALAQVGGLRRWLLAGLCLFFLVPHALRPLYRSDVDEAERRAGLWLAARARLDDVVLDRKPFVAYYAGRPQIWPRAREGLEGLKQALSGYDAVVLVVDNRHFRASRPGWFAALACPPPWLKQLARFTGPDGHEVRLLAYRRGQGE